MVQQRSSGDGHVFQLLSIVIPLIGGTDTINNRFWHIDSDSGSISGASDVADALLLLCNKAGHLKGINTLQYLK